MGDLDLYQQEIASIARAQQSVLDDVRQRLLVGETLSLLEQNGVLHALQVLVENCIGKAKRLLKARGEPVPTSAYDSFTALAHLGLLAPADVAAWHASVGLRNRIVHDYMNLDMSIVLTLVTQQRYVMLSDFLLQPIAIDDVA